MKKRAILFGAASLALAASPIMGFNASAGVTDDPDGSNTGIQRITTIHDTVFADLTFGQIYTFTGDYGKHLYGVITSRNEEVTDEAAKNRLCGYIINGAWSDTGEASNDGFCFEKKEENVVDFYQVSGSTVSVQHAVLEQDWLVWDEITVTNVNSDVILVGDLNDIDHAYQGAGSVSINTHITPLEVYWGSGYALMDGADQDHVKKSSESLTFHATGSYEDAFDGVLVDGEEIKTYEGKSGSTIITLPADYLDTLSVGSHTLTIRYAADNQFTDGEVEVKFTVSENPDTASDKEIAFIAVASVICLCGATVAVKQFTGRR